MDLKVIDIAVVNDDTEVIVTDKSSDRSCRRVIDRHSCRKISIMNRAVRYLVLEEVSREQNATVLRDVFEARSVDMNIVETSATTEGRNKTHVLCC